MGAFTKWGRIATAASSMAALSVNTVFLESPKPVEQSTQQAKEQSKRVAAEKKKVQEEEEAMRLLRRSKTPKMAPQFDGLNFYETFIGSAQR